MTFSKKPDKAAPSGYEVYNAVATLLGAARREMGQRPMGEDGPYGLALWQHLHSAQALADKLASRC